MNLKNLMVDTKSAWVDYPGLEGFSVHVVNLGREKLMQIRKDCMEQKFDRKLKAVVEVLDDKKFIRKFTDASIKNWKGLKLNYLETLMLVDISAEDPNTELPYDQDNAELLVSNSSDFDEWLNRVVFDLENFRTGGSAPNLEKAGDVAE